MKRFNISVNGKAYDVVVDEVIGGAAPAPVVTAAPAAAPAPAPAAAAAPAAPAAAAPVEGGTPVTAPMPGTINEIKVAIGDSVGDGQVLLVLEAMKMENDIVSPKAGKIADIRVRKGDSVNSNDVLLTIV